MKFYLIISAIFSSLMGYPMQEDSLHNSLAPTTTLATDSMDNMIKSQMRHGQIPGVAIVVIQGGKTVLKKGYGYADLNTHLPVTSETLFELGSTTKAFTGLAILKLASEGKIDLAAPIHRYLDGFYATYHDQRVAIQVQDCLNHTSGIPASSIAWLKSSHDKNALKTFIQSIYGLNLQNDPSHHFEYATVNYTILGYLIEVITGQSYEDYILHEILIPLGLQHTFPAYTSNAKIATGYKINYLMPRPYIAPPFRSNTPAGYLISSASDIEGWLMSHLYQSGSLKDVILQSHEPRCSILPESNAHYATGWFHFTTPKGAVLSHIGTNPNFSSYICFSPDTQCAVAVLSNINSSYTPAIGKALLSKILEIDIDEVEPDTIQIVDRIAFILLVFSSLAFLIITFLFTKKMVQQRKFCIKRLASLLLTLPLGLILLQSYYVLPTLFMSGFNWEALTLWGPLSLQMSLFMLYATLYFFLIFLQLLYLFPKVRART